MHVPGLQIREALDDHGFGRQGAAVADFHGGGSWRGCLRGGLVNEDMCPFDSGLELDESLPGEGAFLIGSAGSDPADDPAALIQDGIAVMRHADTLLGEMEADDDT